MLKRYDSKIVLFTFLLRPHVDGILLPALSECPAIRGDKWSPSSPRNGTSTNDPVHLALQNASEHASCVMLIIQATNMCKINFCQ